MPASLTRRRLAPWRLTLRLALGSCVLGAPAWPRKAIAAEPLTLQDRAKSLPQAKAFAKKIAQDSGSVSIAWSDAKNYLLARRAASPVDYRNVLLQIGIRPGRSAAQSQAWLPELIQLDPARVSEPLQPVFADLLVTAATLSWLGDELRQSPSLRREGFRTLFKLASHHRQTFLTGVDDAIARNSLWAVPTLLLVQDQVYEYDLPKESQARVPEWVEMVHANALREHPPTRIRNPELMRDFLLALTAIGDPGLARQLAPALASPNSKVRRVARQLARFVASPEDEPLRNELDALWQQMGASPGRVKIPKLSAQQALARALDLDPAQKLAGQLQEHIKRLDDARRVAWAQEIRQALAQEDYDRLSAYFAQDPQDLVPNELVEDTLHSLDRAASLLLSRGNALRAAELWARAHAIAQSYELKDPQLYATKRDNALLADPELSSHARKTLHRSLRPQAGEIDDRGKLDLPSWQGSAFALFSVLLLPGAWTWIRRRFAR